MILAADVLDAAAQVIRRADALLICAGAGMGVDSGLPDFRGNEGFWRAYPPFAARGLSFIEVAKPQWFRDDPALAWGFYGHRLHLYRDTQPHDGFAILKEWAAAKLRGTFVFTSNVDGHFQRAGFDEAQVCEVHGTIHYLQCAEPCCDAIWPAANTEITIDNEFLAQEPLPRCPRCSQMARPNILMFSDRNWVWKRTEGQQSRLEEWLTEAAGGGVVIIECGAGRAIPTVRNFSEQLQKAGAYLIRINPREAEGPKGTVSLSSGAQEALRAIAERW